MATLDELEQRLAALTSRVDGIETDVDSIEGSVHNHQSSIQSLQNGLNQANANITSLSNKHTQEMNALEAKHDADIAALNGRVTVLETWRKDVVDPTLEDHENRIHKLEYSHIKYTTIRVVKSPLKEGNGITIYIPTDITMEQIMPFNQGIGSQTYHWFTKIFNPNGLGKVSFDLDRRDNGHIKTITIGQNARVLIPTGLKLKFTPEKSSLKVINHKNYAIHKGLQFTIESVESNDGELIIGVCNPTTQVIDLPAGGPLVQLIQLFTYQTIPELITVSEFEKLDDEGYEITEEP